MTLYLYDIPNDFFLAITVVLAVLASAASIPLVHRTVKGVTDKEEKERRITFNGLFLAKILALTLVVRVACVR